MDKPILKIVGLSKVYHSGKNELKALNDVNLTINAGEIFGLLGVNGAGKTTLSSILATLHPPTSGDVLYNDVSIYKNLIEYRQALGFCPQTQNLDQYLTVEENLIFAGRYFLMPEKEIKERADQLIAQLELERYVSFKPNQLSGGTRQRVLIARALMHNPKIIILDEPTVGLDPDIRQKLWQLIRDLKNAGITVILTTHYLDEAEALSDRICILHRGEVQLVETIGALKAQHEQARLETIFLKLTEEYRKEEEENS